jgi:hypothetical protein
LIQSCAKTHHPCVNGFRKARSSGEGNEVGAR